MKSFKLDDNKQKEQYIDFEYENMDIDDEILHENSKINSIPSFDSKFEFAMKKGNSTKSFFDHKTVQSPQINNDVSLVKNGSAFQTQNVNIEKIEGNF